MVLRITAGDATSFSGNLFSTIVFVVILTSLMFFFLIKKYDYFVMMWLSFYFAAPIIKIPFTEIGSLGLLNGVFIILMAIVLFNPKNKYFLSIMGLVLLSFLNIADLPLRFIISRVFEFIAPLLFFYFVIKKCKNTKLIIWCSIIIALINIPLVIYEIIAHPSWGSLVDWRGARIFGSLFWHNSYSFYLIPSILILYASIRTKFSKTHLILFIILLAADIFTLSRSGILSLALGIIIFEFIKKDGLKLTPKKMVLILLIMLALFTYSLAEINDPHLTVSTIRERTVIWETITPFLQNNMILGNGIGSYELYRSQVFNELSPHNYYLGLIFELGLIGLFMVILFVYYIVRNFYNKLKYHNSRLVGALGLSLLISLLTYSLVGGAGFDQAVSLNLWVILGCLLISKELDFEHKVQLND